jgi:DNA-binding transcriptional LysR family regulator
MPAGQVRQVLQHSAIPAMHLRHRHGNIPIELLRSFVAISRHGSFTKAAEELNLTQPAISAQIKRLQRHVGGDLFVKKALGVGLSELGVRVERYARRILALNDQVIAIAGQAPKYETINLGIQSAFARKTLAGLVSRFPISSGRRHRLICGSAPFLAEKLESGYIDLAFMLAQTESRRNLVCEWYERIAWVRAPRQTALPENEPIPFVSREEGFIDSKVLEVLDDQDVPYQIVFSAADLATLAAAVEAGIGIMVAPERVIPDSLIIAHDRMLPKLPELRAAIFCKEGFDLKRNKALVDAFVAAVQPSYATPKWAARRA